MTKLDKKFIEEARELMDRQLDTGDTGEYRKGSRYLENIKARLPRDIYNDYREKFDLKLYPDKSQTHHSRVL